MDENNMLQPAPAVDEVVLTYSPDAPEEIVLCYEAPLPPAMLQKQRQALLRSGDAGAIREPGKRRRPRHGVLVFCVSMGVLVAAAVSLLLYARWREGQDRLSGNWEDRFHQYWEDYEAAEEGMETTIPAYPTGGDFRLKPTEERGTALTAQQVYEVVNPAVVTVVSYLDGAAGIGTGVIISEDGYLITNYHVIEGGSDCGVLLSTGNTYEAALVGYDKENDLAVLKIDQEGLPTAAFGSSDLLSVGDKVYAIGNPLGLKLRGTLTDGIISAINRDVDVDGVTMTLIQTNAALNSGNSGGPLINEYGQVVGINTIKMVAHYEDDSIEGLGFAIPSSTVAHITNCLIATGEVTSEPMLGITVRGQAKLDGETTGLVVDSVSPGFGGDLAGIRPGDIIVSADGEPVATSTDLLRCRRRYEVGQELPLTIYRGGRYMDVLVPLMIDE